MTPQADLGTWGSRVTLMEQLFNAISARFNLNVIYDMEYRTGRVYAKGKPDREISFGEAVAMDHKANRGELLIGRSHYTSREKSLISPAFSFAAQVTEVEVDRETGLVQVNEDVNSP